LEDGMDLVSKCIVIVIVTVTNFLDKLTQGFQRRESKLKRPIKYDRVIQELEKDYLILMTKYLSKLHDAFHEDNGSEASHEDLVNKIKQDGMSMCSNLARIAFDDRTEEQVIEEILGYNYDMADVKHMRELEGLNLYPIVNQLNEYCIKRTDPEWFQFGIHELIQNGKVNPGTVGSKRTQFCKYCGEAVYLGQDTHASRHTKREKA
jgi:hypothetical protein